MAEVEKKQLKHRELMEITDIPAPLTDRAYISPKGQAIVISFCEEVNDTDDIRVRSRVALTIGAFLQIAEMFNSVALQIREASAKQQAEKLKDVD